MVVKDLEEKEKDCQELWTKGQSMFEFLSMSKMQIFEHCQKLKVSEALRNPTILLRVKTGRVKDF